MSILRIIVFGFFITILISCGSMAAGTPQATRLPSATVEPNASPTTNVPPTIIDVPTATTGVVNTDDSLASVLTPEGYHVLGNMNASITFVDYSDFF